MADAPGSVGPVVVGEMKVLDGDGRECVPGEVGEIYMRPTPGDAPTYRYFGATAKTRDGWDSLGDLGYFDEDGFLYLSDRRVDMFTVGGRSPSMRCRSCRRARLRRPAARRIHAVHSPSPLALRPEGPRRAWRWITRHFVSDGSRHPPDVCDKGRRRDTRVSHWGCFPT